MFDIFLAIECMKNFTKFLFDLLFLFVDSNIRIKLSNLKGFASLDIHTRNHFFKFEIIIGLFLMGKSIDDIHKMIEFQSFTELTLFLEYLLYGVEREYFLQKFKVFGEKTKRLELHRPFFHWIKCFVVLRWLEISLWVIVEDVEKLLLNILFWLNRFKLIDCGVSQTYEIRNVGSAQIQAVVLGAIEGWFVRAERHISFEGDRTQHFRRLYFSLLIILVEFLNFNV